MLKTLNTNFDLNSDKLVELVDELPFWSAPFGLKLLDQIRYRKNISILDIGFGAGFPLTNLAMRFGNTCKVYGIDPWEAGIRRVRKKLDQYGIKNVEIIQGEAENIPFHDNSIDLITSNNGINNVSDQNRVLSECSRIMRSGGQFVQTVNLDKSMFEFYEIMEEVLRSKNMDESVEKMHQHIHSKRKPLKEFTDLIEEHDFIDLKVMEDCWEYKFTDGTTLLNHYFIRLAFLESWKGIIPDKKQEEIFKEIEIEMNKQSEKEGLFKLSIPFVVIDCERK